MRAACLLVVAILISNVDDAWACSCVPTSPCAQFGSVDAVFLGKVLDVRREGNGQFARIAVSRTWKGTVDQVVTVSNDVGTSCSFTFTVGERFLVYGRGAGSTFSTFMCAGGGPLRPSDPEPALPPTAGRVTGQVMRFNEAFTSMADAMLPMRGIRVWTSIQGSLKETRTDDQGQFTLDGIPVGIHAVHADLGPSLDGSARFALQSPTDCASVLISPRPSGRLAGTITSEGGWPLSGMEVQAVPVTHDWSRRDLSDAYSAKVDKGGAFEFPEMKPGKYWITVNVVYGPRASYPFAPTYYPGTERREEAVAVDVSIGRAILDRPFTLTRTLPRTTIDAEIVCQDGSRPNSGGVLATQADDRGYLFESSYDPVNGRFRVTVMQSTEYNVRGSVSVPVRNADGVETGIGLIRTSTVRVDSNAPPPLIRLVAPLDRCQD